MKSVGFITLLHIFNSHTYTACFVFMVMCSWGGLNLYGEFLVLAFTVKHKLRKWFKSNLVPRAFYHGENGAGLGRSRDTLNFGVFSMIIYFGKINYIKLCSFKICSLSLSSSI